MKDYFRRAIGATIVGMGLLALVSSAPASSRRQETGEQSEPQSGPAETDKAASFENDPRNLTIGEILSGWPDASRAVARGLLEKYGGPDEFTAAALVWKDNGPWKRTVVYREGAAHGFPSSHADVLEQTVDYKVPLDRFDDLARFNGSLTASRTRGELSSTSDREGSNFMAINLANDIIQGKSIEEARRFVTQSAALAQSGKTTPYTQGFVFKVSRYGTMDPDHSP